MALLGNSGATNKFDRFNKIQTELYKLAPDSKSPGDYKMLDVLGLVLDYLKRTPGYAKKRNNRFKAILK